MAAPLFGRELTVPTTRTTLATILATAYPSASTFRIGEVAIRAGTANTGTIWWGGANVTIAANRWGYLEVGESFAIALSAGATFAPEQLYFIGDQAEDIMHVTALEY